MAAAELTLRFFAHRETESIRASLGGRIGRPQIEEFKPWLWHIRPERKPLGNDHPAPAQHAAGLLRAHHRLGMGRRPGPAVRLQERLPGSDEPLPRFLDDPTAALRAGLAVGSQPSPRLIVELLMRTGMRVGELSALERDAIVQMGEGHWLRIPIGKLHNDRYVPLLLMLVT